MLDGLFMLLTLSTIMAIASFLAGSLPLSFSMSPSRLRLVSTIGMGVLVGTSLIVIIPEGVETLYSASEYVGDAHVRRNIIPRAPIAEQLDTPLPFNLRKRSIGEALWGPSENNERDGSDDTNPLNALPGPVIPDGTDMDPNALSTEPPLTPTGADEVHILDTDYDSKPNSQPGEKLTNKFSDNKPTSSHVTHPGEEPHSERTPHAWIGISLILGFILMYLLDTLPFLSPTTPSRPHSSIYSLSDLSTSPPPTPASPQRSISTTLGLCIHAAADGIALGASSSSQSTTSLSLIIFVAIMVHKAPASFGLTSVLLKQGLGKRGARAHLVVFSLAAPAGAVGTWLVVRALGGGGTAEPALMKWWTGVLLLFSGGTFLYVAMHTMQEDDMINTTPLDPDSQSSGMMSMNGYLDAGPSSSMRGGGGGGQSSRKLGNKEGRSASLVFAAVGGMLLPLLTQVGHAH